MKSKTPLYIEDLIELLGQHETMTVACYDGSCSRVVRHDGLLKLLKRLKKQRPIEQRPTDSGGE